MKFEELQGKRVVFSGEGVPLSIRTKTWQAGALIGITVDKDTDLVISTNIEPASSQPRHPRYPYQSTDLSNKENDDRG